METNDPKTYWNLVNSLKAEQENSDGPELAIDTNTWYDHFRNLNTVKSKFDERLNELNQILKTNKQNKTFTLMDSVIKDKEIQSSISKLKNNVWTFSRTVRLYLTSEILLKFGVGGVRKFTVAYW